MNQFVKKAVRFLPIVALTAMSVSFQSCLDDDDNDNSALYRPTAVVTVCPTADGKFSMVLDDETSLVATNMTSSPFGDKEVRALVNYTEDSSYNGGKGVHINWIDSIRTKEPIIIHVDEDGLTYGSDPIEIVRDWVTVAEDGYLTLRIRTLWDGSGKPHYINLLSGMDPYNPYELELRHDAQGDINGQYGDALIAFNLNNLPHSDRGPVKIKLHWNSFSGKKSLEFDLTMRNGTHGDAPKNLVAASLLK